MRIVKCTKCRLFALSCGRLSLFMATVLLCGFTWGDSCSKAINIYTESGSIMTPAVADKITELCPESGIGHLAAGVRYEQERQIDLAVEEYRKAVTNDPKQGEAYGRLGLLLLKEGKYSGAAQALTIAVGNRKEPEFHRALAQLLHNGNGTALLLYHADQALKQSPDDTELLMWIADAHVSEKEFDQATAAYAKVISLESANKTARIGLAEAYAGKGEFANAIREYQGAAKLDPESRKLHVRLSELYLQSGDKASADNEKRLAGINPDTSDAEETIRRGDLQLLARNYDQAIAEYQSVLKLHPAWPGVLEKLGDTQVAAGRDEEAVVAYRKVLTTEPNNAGVHYKIGILVERVGKLSEAEKEYRQSIELDPKNSDARRRIADIYTLQGKFSKSIGEYNELIKRHGDNPVLHYRLARIHEKNREYRKAIADYQEAVRLSPDNTEIRRELAKLFRIKKEVQQAEKQYLEILKLEPTNLEIRNALLASYVKSKNYDGMLQVLKELVDLSPTDANNHYKLAIVHDSRKEFDLAEAEYRKAIELNNNHAKALNALARLYLKTGRAEEAKRLLEKARFADPDFTEPRELLSILKDEKVRTVKRTSNKSKKKRKIKSGSGNKAASKRK